jgi:hypothetical protein
MCFFVTGMTASKVKAEDSAPLSANTAQLPGDPPSLNLEMKGMRCTGTLTAPRGTTVFLALREDHGEHYDVILDVTIPADAPVRNFPFQFFCLTDREIISDGKAALVQRFKLQLPFPTAFYLRGVGVGGGGAYISSELDADVPVKFEPKLPAGTTILQRNRVYDLATWMAPNTKPTNPHSLLRTNISPDATLMVIVADSIGVVHQFVPLAVIHRIQLFETNHVLQFAKNVPEVTRNIEAMRVQAIANVPPLARLVLVKNDNAWGPPDDYGQYELKAASSQPIVVRLNIGGKIDPASQVTVKLDHGEGILTAHVTQADRTITYTADLETGNRHYPVVYSRTYSCPVTFSADPSNWAPTWLPQYVKQGGEVGTSSTGYPLIMAVYSTPKVPDNVPYSDGEWNSAPWDFPAFTANKKYIATQFPSVVVEIGVPKD